MSEQPPIIMYRRGGMLMPHGPMDDELLRSFPADAPLRVRLTQPRNPRAMRFYWALLTIVKENMPEPSPSVEVLHEAIKVLLGYTITVKTPRGDVVLPGSVSFDKMAEPEFRAYLESFKHLVLTRIIPGLDNEQFERAARDMLGAPLEPAPRRVAARPEQAALPPPPDDDEPLDAEFVEVEEEDDDPFAPSQPDDEDDDGPPFSAPPEDDDPEPFVATVTVDDPAPAYEPPLVVATDVRDTIRQIATRAAARGEPREPPPGLHETEAELWLEIYDAERAPPEAEEEGPPLTVADDTAQAAEASPEPPSAQDDDEEGLADLSAAQDRTDLAAAIDTLAPIGDWTMLKRTYQATLQQEWYGNGSDENRTAYRRAVWERLDALIASKHALAETPAQDYDAMWLWIEFGATSKGAIDGLWPVFWRSRAYANATSDDQSAIAGLMIRRQKELPR